MNGVAFLFVLIAKFLSIMLIFTKVHKCIRICVFCLMN